MCTYNYTHVHVYPYVYMYMYTHMCICTCIPICVHVHVYAVHVHAMLLLIALLQAKTVLQAEIDAACEAIDFFRFATQQGLDILQVHMYTCMYMYIC